MGTAWYTQLGITHDPFSPEPAQGPWIFETPVITGCLNTLVNIAATGAFIGLVKGQRGSGKTTLLNRLSERLRDRPDMDLVRLTWTREKALAQALGHSVGLEDTARLAEEPRQCLREHLARLRAGGLAIVIAIDEAHQLTPEDLALLLELSLSPNPNENGALHTLLFAESSIETQLKAIPSPPPMDRIYALNLTPLGSEQTPAYLAHRLQAAGFTGKLPLPRVALVLIQRRAGGVPLAINREAERWLQLYSNPARRWIPQPLRRLNPWQRNAAGITLAAVIAVGLGIWLLSDETPQTTLSESVKDETQLAPATAPPPEITALPAGEDTPRQPALMPADSEPSRADKPPTDEPPADHAEPAGADAAPIATVPQPPSQETLLNAANDDSAAASDTASAEESSSQDLEPVYEPKIGVTDVFPPASAPPSAAPFAEQQITDATTEAREAEPLYLEDENVAAPAEMTEENAISAVQVDQQEKLTEASIAPTAPEEKPAADSVPVAPDTADQPQLAKATDSSLSEPVKEATEATGALPEVHRDAWFQQRNAEEYFIQLMAVGDETALRDFILARQAFPAEPGYFRAYSQGREWYVLVLGPYPDRRSAQAALQALPPALRRYQPWPRSLASIQAAMNAYTEHTQR